MSSLSESVESILNAVHAAEQTPANRTLRNVALPAEAEVAVARLVRSTRASGVATLTTDDLAAWGALALFVYAREKASEESEDAVALYESDEVDALAKGKRLWLRFGFEGVEHELKRFTKAQARRAESEGEPEGGDEGSAREETDRNEAKDRRTGLRLEATPLPPRDGVHRVSVRAVGARRGEAVRCTLVSEDAGATVTLHAVESDEVRENRVHFAVNAPPVELRFSVTAPAGMKVRVRLQVASDETMAKSLRLPGVFVPLAEES